MSIEVLTPPHYKRLPKEAQVIFLAGPIQGTPDWQSTATRHISIWSQSSSLVIANPRRQYLDGDFDYYKQVDWERFYLEEAKRTGAPMFWLAKETEPIPGRAYAQTTRIELAEAKRDLEHKGTPLTLGIESGFSGAKYLRYIFNRNCAEVDIQARLEDLCMITVELVENREID